MGQFLFENLVRTISAGCRRINVVGSLRLNRLISHLVAIIVVVVSIEIVIYNGSVLCLTILNAILNLY